MFEPRSAGLAVVLRFGPLGRLVAEDEPRNLRVVVADDALALDHDPLEEDVIERAAFLVV
ncbi:MAG TPA: hypothetical protein VNQ77_09100 [Frankiaceae bacterium]|nr:hypothetical protein [Frankiaceae bacterium]